MHGESVLNFNWTQQGLDLLNKEKPQIQPACNIKRGDQAIYNFQIFLELPIRQLTTGFGKDKKCIYYCIMIYVGKLTLIGQVIHV